MSEQQEKNLQQIKSRLINTTLVVLSITGLPLLIASLFRAVVQDISLFIYVHTAVYLFIVMLTLLRNRINYNIKALFLIFLIYSLAITDLFQTGFVSASVLWLLTSIILCSLLFDLKKSLWAIGSTILIYIFFYYLYSQNIILQKIDFNQYATNTMTQLMHLLIIVLIGLMTAFAVKHIQSNLISSISTLSQQKINLEKTTFKLEKEIEIRRESEKRALNNEKNFRNIFETSSDAIFIIDENGTIIDFNPAFVEMTGFSENELFNKNIEDIFPVQIIKNCKEQTRSLFGTKKNVEFQYENKNKVKRNIDCRSSHIIFNESRASIYTIRDFTSQKNQEKTNYLTAIAAEEKERNRLSKELHDGLGPLLSTLKIYLDVLYANPEDSEVKSRIENTLNESIKTVKEISNNLSPYVLENLGLAKAIESYIESIRYKQKIDIRYHTDLNHRLNPETEISIYRFVTELFHNTLKHAYASEISIEILNNFDKLDISYSDNGIGFNMHTTETQGKGIGLFNLNSRIDKLGGKVSIVTAPGEGFELKASLPA